jgi:hypothetical protein
MTDAFDDPDAAVQVEDPDPETLAGEKVNFDPDESDGHSQQADGA